MDHTLMAPDSGATRDKDWEAIPQVDGGADEKVCVHTQNPCGR